MQANDESVDETFHSFSSKTSTFLSFHHRLAALLFSALKVEQDSRNRQSLLAGLHVLVRDTVETEHPDHILTSLSPPTSPLTLADVATSASPPPALGLNFEPARRLDQSMAARLSRSVGDDASSSLDNTTPRTRARLRGHVTKSGSWGAIRAIFSSPFSQDLFQMEPSSSFERVAKRRSVSFSREWKNTLLCLCWNCSAIWRI